MQVGVVTLTDGPSAAAPRPAEPSPPPLTSQEFTQSAQPSPGFAPSPSHPQQQQQQQQPSAGVVEHATPMQAADEAMVGG